MTESIVQFGIVPAQEYIGLRPLQCLLKEKVEKVGDVDELVDLLKQTWNKNKLLSYSTMMLGD